MADVTYRRRFGDRKDGRLLRSLSPFYKFMPYIMTKRDDALNYFSGSVEITAQEEWLRSMRKADWKSMGMLHLFLAAYVRAVASCPGLNRFVSGQKIYARNGIEVVMMVRRALTTEADETSIKLQLEPTDTVFDIYRKLADKVDEVKAADGDNGTDRTAEALMRFPGLILKFVVWFLNLLDYFGLLPQSLIDVSPFHGSMIITDLGSIGTAPIYHHLYNFGNLPLFISMGAKRRAVELDKTGTPVQRKYVDYKVVMDERTVDGLYFANALKYFQYYLKNPSELEHPPERVLDDVM